MKVAIVTVSLLLVLLTLNIIIVFADDVYTEFLHQYEEVARLAQQGIDVSDIVRKLSEVYRYIEENRTEDAAKLLNETKIQIDSIKRRAPSIVLLNNVEKGVAVVAIASIPILTYLLLPRIYLYLWYRVRRKWVVKHGYTR